MHQQRQAAAQKISIRSNDFYGHRLYNNLALINQTITKKAIEKQLEIKKCIVSCLLIFALLIYSSFSAMAQAQNDRSYLLESGTPVVLRVTETANFSNKADNGTISAIIENDVYSADGTQVVVKRPSNLIQNQMAHGAKQERYA